jgi:integration host factor subunit beta
MNRVNLVKRLSNKLISINEEDIKVSADRILGLITETLQNNDRLEVRNFGSFSVRKREQRISRNPKTGTSILVQSKSHPYFRASKFLKESLNK